MSVSPWTRGRHTCGAGLFGDQCLAQHLLREVLDLGLMHDVHTTLQPIDKGSKAAATGIDLGLEHDLHTAHSACTAIDMSELLPRLGLRPQALT